MNSPGAPGALVAHLVVLSIISFGGIPAMLPDLRDFVVAGNECLHDVYRVYSTTGLFPPLNVAALSSLSGTSADPISFSELVQPWRQDCPA